MNMIDIDRTAHELVQVLRNEFGTFTEDEIDSSRHTSAVEATQMEIDYEARQYRRALRNRMHELAPDLFRIPLIKIGPKS